MSFICRKGTMADLPVLIEIEKKATPSLNYLEPCMKEFLDPARGELVVADEDGVPRGFAHFAIHYDGSGWLECLRVDPEHQRRGCGAAIWQRFMELCEEFHVSHVGMYTGLTNYPSKVLGERNGLHVDYQNREGSLKREEIPQVTAPEGFVRLTDPDAVEKAIAPFAKGYEGYLCMNRTYYRLNRPLYAGLAADQEVWSDGESTVVLGARFLKERALHIGLLGGDADACLRLAIEKFKASGLPALTCVFPSSREDLEKLLERYGFTLIKGHIIVLERDF